MSASEKDGKLTVDKSALFGKTSIVLIVIILTVIAASVITGAAGDAIAKKRAYQAKISQPDYGNIAKIFENKPVLIDDDPDYGTVESFLVDSPNYKETGRIKVKGLMLHSIGATQTSAESQAASYGGSNFYYGGVHGFIDSDTGVLYHTLPWSQQAWHAGDGAKDYIGVEMCETDAGYYSDDYVLHVDDKERAEYNAKTAYDAAVALFARLCVKYEFNPLQDGIILSHREGALRGIATQHGDPDEYWANVGVDYTMDGFRQDVYHYMNNKIAAYMKNAKIRQIQKKYVFHEKA